MTGTGTGRPSSSSIPRAPTKIAFDDVGVNHAVPPVPFHRLGELNHFDGARTFRRAG